MNIRLLGNRLLVKYLPPTGKIGRIILPDVAEKHDTHRLGIVQTIGPDCKLAKVGDTVCFQVNDVMSWAQVYKQLANGEPMLHLLESELLGRVNGPAINPESFEIMGDYLLLKVEVRRPESQIIVPKDAVLTPDMLHYMVAQKGQTVDLPIKVGQEVIVNHGRVSRMYMTRTLSGGTNENLEFGYTSKEWVYGVVEAEDGNKRTDEVKPSTTGA